jgi:hypothetical protein
MNEAAQTVKRQRSRAGNELIKQEDNLRGKKANYPYP